MNSTNWKDRRVAILGLGRHGGGVGAARFLARRGASITVCDSADRATLSASIAALADVPIAGWHFGPHRPADLQAAEFVVVNPAVRFDHPLLRELRERGARLISEIELCLAYLPAQTIAVTGTSGKSTTATMLADMLRATGQRVWLGGNLGGSLLDSLANMTERDWAVVELSSFQLAHLSRDARFPSLAVITNCTPHHLDWHGSWANYAAAKQRLLLEAPAQGTVVLNLNDEVLAAWSSAATGKVLNAWPDAQIPPLLVPGAHNRMNAACAAAAAEVAGVDAGLIVAALAEFHGLDHRLQYLGTFAGRRCYNDSKATSPAATMAALSTMDGPTWLLAGGADNETNFTELANVIATRATGAAFFGAARHRLYAALRAVTTTMPVHVCEHLETAFAWCLHESQPGDAILLSPACASHDQYADFAARGVAFAALLSRLT